MKKIAVLLIFFTSLISAQEKLEVSFDYSAFQYDDTTSYVEFYYSFEKQEMTSVKVGEQVLIKGELQLVVTDVNSNEDVINQSWIIESDTSGNETTGLLSLALAYGNYVFDARFTDQHKKTNFFKKKIDVALREFDKDQFSISDIQVASEIVQFSKNTESIFYKNTLEVIPNPSLVFGEGIPIAYFYSEFYGLQNIQQAPALRVDHQLINNFNRVVYEKTKYIKRNKSTAIDVGAINVMKYPSGSYTLRVAVTDTASRENDYVFRKLYIYNPSVKDTTELFNPTDNIFETELAAMEDEELNGYFDISSYVAVQAEKNAWSKLRTIEGKRQFLFKFWQKRDNNPSTRINEYKNAYFERYNYANIHYDNIVYRKGYKSDMGRVYIVYGQPNEVQRHPYDGEKLPYEIWIYEDMEGGASFVFCDFNDNGNYKLVHSSKRGELSNPYWEDDIKGQADNTFRF